MWTIRYLHSLKYFGPFARALIEIAGGWSILLVGTGLYLWWPRGQAGGVVTGRGTPRRRVFWRDLHAVTGIFVGAFIVFLAVTGMPWSGVWGAKVNEWANGNNFGYPAGVRVAVPMSDQRLATVAQTSWSLEQARIPLSAAKAGTAAPIGLDAAIAIIDRLGLHPGYAVDLPVTPTGVYSASVYPKDLSRQRVVHLDQVQAAIRSSIRVSRATGRLDGGSNGDQRPYGPGIRARQSARALGRLHRDRDAGGVGGRDVVEASPERLAWRAAHAVR